MYILFPLTRYNKSVYSTLCSGEALPHRVLHLRGHGDIMSTPLLYYYGNGMWYYVTSSDITETLCLSVRLLGPTIGFLPKNVFTKSICAAGAMAVLNARVDGETICIIGRWCFNTMLCYSHVQDAPIMNIFSSFMVRHRKFTLQSLHDFPCFYPPPSTCTLLSRITSWFLLACDVTGTLELPHKQSHWGPMIGFCCGFFFRY